ncbi:hypothetical protein OUZ56_033723 [Daphnia magna]|uniref:Uncharacterized protein n=1 Tax=Daphnia magna TaxID=35525 RepID=A0ABR0BB20_9CRUS|nr:hypothetical protein OUZ56_033723 [Daphnia magna]
MESGKIVLKIGHQSQHYIETNVPRRLWVGDLVGGPKFPSTQRDTNLVSARRSRRVETVTRTSQWDYPGPLIGSLHPYILLCLSAFRSHIFLILN